MQTDSQILAQSQQLDMAGGWNDLWSALTGAFGEGFWDLLTIIGVALVVFSILSYLWQHRRGTNWGSGGAIILGMLIVGAVLMAPGLLIPLFLTLLDFIINFFIGIFQDNIGSV